MSTTPHRGPLWRLVRRHRVRLLLTYALLAAEAAVDLLQPLALGWAVQSLVTGGGAGLTLFVLQQLVGCGLGMARRLWDARFFSQVAAELAQGLVLDQRAAGLETSAVAARAGLSAQVVDFLERDIPFVVRASLQGVGALVLLGLVAPRLVPFAVALFIPAVGLGAVYAGYARRGTTRLHDEMERTVRVVAGGTPDEVRAHFGTLAIVRKLLARAETAYFGAWQAVGLCFIAAVFVCDPGEPRTAGEWTALLGYAYVLLATLINAPRMLEQAIRFRDIAGRLRGS